MTRAVTEMPQVPPALSAARTTAQRIGPRGGVNLLVNLSHYVGLTTKLKVGTIRNLHVGFGAGYTFHR